MDLQLPRSALVNKFVAKTNFYKRVKLSIRLQNAFINKIQKITWKYKLAEDTIGISKTDSVPEIQVFEIELKEQIIPQSVLKVIDKAIPYPILYIFIYNENFAFGITLKEKTSANNYYFSEWNEPLSFDFTGIDLEKVYQKLIRAFIRNEAFRQYNFEDVIDLDSRIKELEKEIATLQKKIRKQKQFNRKVELNKILLEKKQQLYTIQKGIQ